MDDVLLNKVTIIKRCLTRIKEEYVGHEKDFETNFTRQDSIILNLQRACEASIDIGTRLLRLHKLEVPQYSREIFAILEKNKIIPGALCQKLQSMVGFRNIAVHDYKALNLDIVKSILEKNINDFLELAKLALAVS
ncbi:MAG: DUF86 domain-containing protein [Chlamydiae bacterium]|nr:DUF86 domain-containing protein [Chlamydiota bacterium]